MAALRIFARSAIAPTRASPILPRSCKNITPCVQQLQNRWASINVGIGIKEKTIELPDFEVTRDPEEWSFVEWALPLKIVPKAPTEVKVYPSGWKPQSPDSKSLAYFVERTKNHMMPVYLRRTHRGTKRVTYVRKIQGDIMLLENELRLHLQKLIGKQIGSEINEPAGTIKFRGDYVNLTRIYLKEKGF